MNSTERVAHRYMTRMAGAAEFMVYGTGTEIQEVFNQLMAKASEEDEIQDGYSGTIGDKFEFKLRSEKSMTMTDAKKFAAHDVNQADKWGPAFCVPVAKKPGGPVIGYLFYGLAAT